MEREEEGKIRLQKAISRAGVASRRHAEDMIANGRVSVNGAVVREMGLKVDPLQDRIEVDGKPLPKENEEKITVMLHKPRGYLSQPSDSYGRKVVSTLVSRLGVALLPVGRLDKDSEGLLLMSNDGDLIARLTHPRYGHRKIYEVEVSGKCTGEELAALNGPMTIDGYAIRPVKVSLCGRRQNHAILKFTLSEGRNRQIRKMCEAVGLNVTRLVRISIDSLELGNLAPGAFRRLSDGEIASLMR